MKKAKVSKSISIKQDSQNNNNKNEQFETSANKEISKTKKWIPYLLFLFAIILYLPTKNHDYAFDDSIVITENNYTQKGIDGIPFLISHDFFAGSSDGAIVNLSGGRYRPLSLVMFAIEYHFFGLNPKIGHLINILIYALSAMLLFKLLSIWFKEKMIIPLFACLIFIAHPIHTEVVANIKSRDELMALFLILTSFLFIHRYLETKYKKFLILALLSFLGSLLSKETALTFVVLTPLTLWIFESIERKKLIQISVGISFTAGFYLILRYAMLGKGLNIEQTDLMENPLYGANLSEKLGTVSVIVLKYWQLLISPISLSCDYSYNQIPRVTISNFTALSGIIAHILLFIFVLVKVSKKNKYAWCILLILIPLSPATNLFFNLGAPLGERFLYIPSLGFCIMIALFFSFFMENPTFQKYKSKSGSIVIISLILVISTSLTFQRNKVWKNNETLFSNDSKITENSAKIHYYHANTLLKKYLALSPDDQKMRFKEFLPETLKEFKKSVSINPKFHTAWYNIALTHYQFANLKEDKKQAAHEANKSIYALEKALEIEKNHILSLELAAEIYSRHLNQPDKTITYCKRLTEEAGIKRANIWSILGIAYFLKGETNLAFEAMEKAVKLEPENPQMWQNMAAIYGNSGNEIKAQECLKKAESLK